MVIHRFYCENITAPTVELTDSQPRHLYAVLRLKPNDPAELFDGRGNIASACIVSANSKKAVLKIESMQTTKKLKNNNIIIATSIAKGDRFDWLIAKCTELGIDRIIPVIFERTVKLPKNPKILTRWKKITIESAKQCKAPFLPTIDKPVKLTEALIILTNDHPNSIMLLGCPDENCPALTDLPTAGKNTIAFIGPEGGLTSEEETFLKQKNVKPVKLTNTILRIETAAIAFASALAIQRDRK
ncbi:MAG: 16S rRNA (uracil(1498)-N(3))-methyltransferase [Planctomycetes bacterium]|nr:16S rRNA (uracil(1498)-N(3))-methyltransferase [Planctomycetota bacterium]